MSGTANDFTIGSDTVLSIISDGGVAAWTILTEFEAKQMTADLDSTAIDGTNRYRYVEKGWEGTFGSSTATTTASTATSRPKEANRYLGLQPPTITITQD